VGSSSSNITRRPSLTALSPMSFDFERLGWKSFQEVIDNLGDVLVDWFSNFSPEDHLDDYFDPLRGQLDAYRALYPDDEAQFAIDDALVEIDEWISQARAEWMGDYDMSDLPDEDRRAPAFTQRSIFDDVDE
jgi:hypothetical protein